MFNNFYIYKKKKLFIYLGPSIDTITAICQSKDEQVDWILKINNQIENNCVFNKTSGKITNVSQNSLSRLSDYFSHLVCKGVINRTLLKLILYTQYINNFDTSKVIRRNSNIGITQKNKHNSIYHVKSNLLNNVVLPRHCFSLALKEDENVFRKKLLFTPLHPTAYQDLTKSILYKNDNNYNYQQNLLNYNLNIPNFKSKHLTIPLQGIDNKSEIYLSDNQNSIYFLGDFKMSYLNDNCYENNTVLSEDFQYLKSKDQNSFRSYYDSGLADITQKLPLSKTDTSLNSSEYLYKCTLPIHKKSCIFEVECLDKKSSDKKITYRSSLYAHWWLKKSI